MKKLLTLLSIILLVFHTTPTIGAIDHLYYSSDLQVGETYVWDILNASSTSDYFSSDTIEMTVKQNIGIIDQMNLSSVYWDEYLAFQSGSGTNLTGIAWQIYTYHVYPTVVVFDNGTETSYFDHLHPIAGTVVDDVYVQVQGYSNDITEIHVNTTTGIILYFDQVLESSGYYFEMKLEGYTPVEVPDDDPYNGNTDDTDTTPSSDPTSDDGNLNFAFPLFSVAIIVIFSKNSRHTTKN